MPVINKRTGQDRRRSALGPPTRFGERRIEQRRQTVISDISYLEWANHFAQYAKRKREEARFNINDNGLPASPDENASE